VRKCEINELASITMAFVWRTHFPLYLTKNACEASEKAFAIRKNSYSVAQQRPDIE
jgi:hypothetical protein